MDVEFARHDRPSSYRVLQDDSACARQRERERENERRAVSADELRPQETRAEPRSTFLDFIMEPRAPGKKRNIRAAQSVSPVPLTGFYDRCFYGFSILFPLSHSRSLPFSIPRR